MRAFEISVNSKKLCTAGIDTNGVLSAIVNWVATRNGEDLFLDVGGLVSTSEEHVRWINQKPVRVGDRVTIRVVEKKLVDQPSIRYRADPKKALRDKKRYVRSLAKELGWSTQNAKEKVTGANKWGHGAISHKYN